MASEGPVRDYLARRAAAGPWRLEGADGGTVPGAVVVPAFAEAAALPAFLESLRADPTLPAIGFAVVVVVNHRPDATASEKEDDAEALALLRDAAPRLPFPLWLLDAASPGLELPLRDGGVGLARKLGHDLVLPLLRGSGAEPVLVSLDADTHVEPGYGGALARHFATVGTGGATIPFAHRASADDRENRAVGRYELFLRCYVAGLAFAGSPYAFHTVGSAMACTASAYVKAGGMNRRRAGEDFYFLQEVAKTSGVRPVAGTAVRPSPRRSHRVPFGTGRAVGALLDGEEGAVLFHQRRAFELLKGWLDLAREACRTGDADLPKRAAPEVAGFLADQGFPRAWERLRGQHRTPERLEKAFHGWFDGFRTMKLLHTLADGPLPRLEPDQVLGTFPEAWGAPGLEPAERLELLRASQGAGGKGCTAWPAS